MASALRFCVRPESFLVCRDPDGALAARVARTPFGALVRDDDGTSVVLDANIVPPGTDCAGPWRVLSLIGPFPFTAVGVLSSFLHPLADADIPVIVICGHDTDHVLVPAIRLEPACAALVRAGHERVDPS